MRSLLCFVATAVFATSTCATDWLTLPGTYSHDPQSGMRVSQYAPATVPTGPIETSYRSSGYRQQRSTLAYGQSADNYHRVETWGDPVRPYGEWRFPFRPYSTPYPNWGQPYAGLNLGFGPGVGPGFGHGGFQGRRPPVGYPGGGDPGDEDGSAMGGFPDSGSTPPGRQRPPAGFPLRRDRDVPPVFDQPGNPYPAGGNSPYPVAPYYDGYYPNYRD